MKCQPRIILAVLEMTLNSKVNPTRNAKKKLKRYPHNKEVSGGCEGDQRSKLQKKGKQADAQTERVQESQLNSTLQSQADTRTERVEESQLNSTLQSQADTQTERL